MSTLREVREHIERHCASVREAAQGWLPGRPEVVQRMAEQLPPEGLYQVRDDAPICDEHACMRGALVTMRSYYEDGEHVSVIVCHVPGGCDEHVGMPATLPMGWLRRVLITPNDELVPVE